MKISDAEWRIMRIVWRRGPVTAADVIEELLPETHWSHRTVRTLLARLVEKGVLATEQDGNRYVYHPKTSQSDCVQEEAQSFVEKVFDGDAAELLIHFVRNEAISDEQIDELKRLLDEKGKEEGR